MSATESKVALQARIKASTLNTTFDILQTVADEAVFHIGDGGLRVSMVCASNVALHDPLQIDTGAFESTPEGSFPIGANIDKFEESISKAQSDEVVSLGYKSETRKLAIEHGKYTSDLACIDPESIRKEPDMNPLDHENVFAVERSDLLDVVEHAGSVSDYVTFYPDPETDEIVVRGEGDTDTRTATLDPDDFLGDYNVSVSEKSMYSYAYLAGKGSKKAGILRDIPKGEVVMHLDGEYPMKMSYEYAGGNASVDTYIAPRVEN